MARKDRKSFIAMPQPRPKCLSCVPKDIVNSHAIQSILHNPIQFAPATYLTFEDEEGMAKSKYGRVRKSSPSWGNAVGNSQSKGIRNPGNLCYRNSTLQGLVHSPKFVNGLKREHVNCKRPRCVACRLKDLVKVYWAHSSAHQMDLLQNSMKTTQKVLEQVWPTSGVKLNHQQDAHDFYIGLYDIMSQQLQRNGFPAIRSILASRVRKALTCTQCQHTSTTLEYEPSLGINLPPGPHASRSLPTLLAASLPAHEPMPDYACNSCKRTGPVTMSKTLAQAPDLLVIQIRRFVFDFRTARAAKDDTHVRDVAEELDLTTVYDRGHSEALEYSLVAVVQHRGTLAQGHYVAVARAPDGEWYTTNDRVVARSRVRDAVEGVSSGFRPYMLYYKREY